MTSPQPTNSIIKRDGTLVPYSSDRIQRAIHQAAASSGYTDRVFSEAITERVETALSQTYTASAHPTVEDIQDIVEATLMKSERPDVARRFIIYRHEHAMARSAKESLFQVNDNIPYKKIYEVLLWNINHGCETVESLNELCHDGHFPDLVQQTEQRYADEVSDAAAQILSQPDRYKVVIIAGPSSSGKTTTTIKLREHLENAGLSLKAINIDNYFFNLVDHPQDEFGDYDYEAPQALDLDLIDQQLEELIAGKTIKTPDYNFKTGKRTLDCHEMSLAPNEILLIDSLHGLYDGMTSRIPAESKFRVYVETLGQLRTASGHFLRWADNRMLRRMIRDRDHRNMQPVETITHWHYVRSSELQFIIPFMSEVDVVINTALPYELPILKRELFSYLEPTITRYRDDPSRLDAFLRASRVHDFLAEIDIQEKDDAVPSTSLLREFIGGSDYTY